MKGETNLPHSWQIVHVANFSYCPGSKREAALNVLKFVLFPGRISLGVRNPKLTLLDYGNTRLPGGSGWDWLGSHNPALERSQVSRVDACLDVMWYRSKARGIANVLLDSSRYVLYLASTYTLIQTLSSRARTSWSRKARQPTAWVVTKAKRVRAGAPRSHPTTPPITSLSKAASKRDHHKIEQAWLRYCNRQYADKNETPSILKQYGQTSS